MKLYNQARKYGARVAVPAAMLLPGLALAGGPDTTAITAAGTTAQAYGAAVAGVLILIWGLRLGYRKFFGS
jgi:hypothetical protein